MEAVNSDHVRLSCRLSCYGPCAEDEDRVANHLQDLGITEVEIPVPAHEQIGSTLAWWSTFGIVPRTLIGKLDLASEAGVATATSDQCRVASAMGIQFLFLSVKKGGLTDREAFQRDASGQTFLNLHAMLPADERGTFYYRREDVWNSFDSMAVSRSMVDDAASKGAWAVVPDSYEIFKLPQMVDPKGAPRAFRRYKNRSTGEWYTQHGYSDHFPVRVKLAPKE